MQRSLFSLAGSAALLVLALALAMPARGKAIDWRPTWSDAAFAQAAREHKFVLLDLHAVWCHWCHVMDTTTYADPAVQAAIAKHYVAVSVDADSDPALTSRYGDWGWPATIVLAADGTEIVKRRGYIAPAQMVSLLDAIVVDPSPGPSVSAAVAIANTSATSLAQKDRASLTQTFDALYDMANNGWGTEHKYVDASAIEWSLATVDSGNQLAMTKVRRTLDANLNLIDPVWGGVYQYSDEIDWKSPHFEKLLSYQADDLRLYSDAYTRWHRKTDLEAAQKIYGYLTKFLAAPDGGFYVSQDADVSAQLTGHDFYAKDDTARRAIGMPRIDTHEYSRETGWAIRALCKYYDVTGDVTALSLAERGAKWAQSTRSLPGGGFSHGGADYTSIQGAPANNPTAAAAANADIPGGGDHTPIQGALANSPTAAAHANILGGGDHAPIQRAPTNNPTAAANTGTPGGAHSPGVTGKPASASMAVGASSPGPSTGSFLDDNISMTQAFLALYRSTGQRDWLRASIATLDFIDATLRDPQAGYVASPPVSNTRGVFRQPIRDVAQNVALVRAANMLHHYTGTAHPLRMAQHGMKFLSAFAAAASDQFRPDILLADHELLVAPIHITIVGGKDDPAAQALHTAALRYPGDYLQVDWWDRREGKLPDPTISYPVLKQAAAFACTANACSTPVYEAGELLERVHSVLN